METQEGLAMVSPLRTRGSLLETTKIPSAPVSPPPSLKLNVLLHARQAKGGLILKRENLETENRERGM